MRRTFLIIVGALLAASCGPSDTTDTTDITVTGGSSLITITGQLIYRERIALIPDGTATITLSDVSRQDVAAPVIAETTIELGDRQIPIPFELAFDEADTVAAGSYSVRATISDRSGTLRWTTDTANLIDLEQGSIDVGELMLVGVRHDASKATGESAIVGEWTVTAIGGRPVITESAPTLSFASDGALGGNASCNSYSTTYSTSGSELNIESAIATTLMACDPSIDRQERAFLGALESLVTEQVGSFEIDDTGTVLSITSIDSPLIDATR